MKGVGSVFVGAYYIGVFSVCRDAVDRISGARPGDAAEVLQRRPRVSTVDPAGSRAGLA